MTSRKFHLLFGGEPRKPESTIEQRHMDLAASIQKVTEEVILRLALTIQRETKQNNLVLAGGVALNCVANGRLFREGPFQNIWIQPAAGDAGGALGSAMFVWHQLLGKPRQPSPQDCQQGSLLGPAFSSQEIQTLLETNEIPHEVYETREDLHREVADLLAEGKVVGWFQGRMEYGPRALGARSILADPKRIEMQSNLNLKIKFRESFRPFAPAVLAEHACQWFDFPGNQESPYMLMVAPVHQSKRIPASAEQLNCMHHHPDLRQRLLMPRSLVPAITHVDGSARLQTVDEQSNANFHGLLEAFYERTGCPLLVNTSFNVRGEPIVCTPEDALRCFQATEMDVLVLENLLIRRERWLAQPSRESREIHLAAFSPD